MQSARVIFAAGRTLTGMSTIPASPTHSVSAPVTAGLRLSQTRQPFASRPGAGCSPAVSHAATSTNRSRRGHAFAFSNRHMMQLEIAVSPAEPTRSLFLIVTKQPSLRTRGIVCRAGSKPPIGSTQPPSSEMLVAQARLACVRFHSTLATAQAISNRHLVQLEITASSTESTRSLFLIVTKPRLCSQPFLHFPLATPVVRGTRREYTRRNMRFVSTQQFQIGKLPA
jgi:hypothetical protein